MKGFFFPWSDNLQSAPLNATYLFIADEFDTALPEAPPNSVEPVERALSTYDDDFLSLEVDEIIDFNQ